MRLKYKELFNHAKADHLAAEGRLTSAQRELDRLRSVLAAHGGKVITAYGPMPDQEAAHPIVLSPLDYEASLAFLRSNLRSTTGQDTWDGYQTAFWHGRRLVRRAQ